MLSICDILISGMLSHVVSPTESYGSGHIRHILRILRQRAQPRSVCSWISRWSASAMCRQASARQQQYLLCRRKLQWMWTDSALFGTKYCVDGLPLSLNFFKMFKIVQCAAKLVRPRQAGFWIFFWRLHGVTCVFAMACLLTTEVFLSQK